MKISIITACFNSAETIEDTITSVLSQDYESIEYIIVDGGSTDSTFDILKTYRDQIHKYAFLLKNVKKIYVFRRLRNHCKPLS